MKRILPAAVLALLLPALLSITGCSSTGSSRAYYGAYYGYNPYRYYRPPVYVVDRPEPGLPDEPVAVPLPEPPPDMGMPDVDFGGDMDFGGVDIDPL